MPGRCHGDAALRPTGAAGVAGALPRGLTLWVTAEGASGAETERWWLGEDRAILSRAAQAPSSQAGWSGSRPWGPVPFGFLGLASPIGTYLPGYPHSLVNKN